MQRVVVIQAVLESSDQISIIKEVDRMDLRSLKVPDMILLVCQDPKGNQSGKVLQGMQMTNNVKIVKIMMRTKDKLKLNEGIRSKCWLQSMLSQYQASYWCHLVTVLVRPV